MSDYMTAGTCGRAAPEGGWWALAIAMFVEGCADTTHRQRRTANGGRLAEGWQWRRAGKQASKQPMRNPPPGWVGAKRATAAADGYLYDICGLHTSRANNG